MSSNLFVWPVTDLKDSGPTSTTREGFNPLHWTCSGMSLRAVSDINPAALRHFEAEYDRHTNGTRNLNQCPLAPRREPAIGGIELGSAKFE